MQMCLRVLCERGLSKLSGLSESHLAKERVQKLRKRSKVCIPEMYPALPINISGIEECLKGNDVTGEMSVNELGKMEARSCSQMVRFHSHVTSHFRSRFYFPQRQMNGAGTRRWGRG